MTALPPQAGRVCLGWQHALDQPEPGPPPRRPVPAVPEQVQPGWLAAQHREERLLARPAKLSLAACLALAAVTLLLGQAGGLNTALTVTGTVAFTAVAVASGACAWRGRLDLRARIAAETARVAAARAAQETGLAASQEEHARLFRDWEAREREFTGKPQWHPVTLPAGIDRVDVAGGTASGWSALLTMLALPLLDAGGQVTVIDLSESAVAGDLVRVAAGLGTRPLVWLLPGDLPRFDLGTGLPASELAEVLAASAAASPAAGGDPAADHAILQRIAEVLGDGARAAQLTAALRVLGQVGDPRDDVRRGLLTTGQLDRITGLFGRSAADRVVTERAWTLEARLRVIEPLGSDPVPLPRSKLRVVAADPSAGAFPSAVAGTYVTVALTHLLRRAAQGPPWRHTVFLAGAEKLHSGVLDQLTGACTAARTGLVLAYASVPAPIRERLGRGNAALAVMRLGNAEDAKAVSEQIGTEHRLVLSQLTQTVGASVSDSTGASYTSTAGTAESASVSASASHTTGTSTGRGHTSDDPAPFAHRSASASREASESAGLTGSWSLTDGISTATSWGVTTAQVTGTSEAAARTAQRSREFLVEPHELQQLPPSAVIISYAAPGGRQLVLADANPAIVTLPGVAAAAVAEAGLADQSWATASASPGAAEPTGATGAAGPAGATGPAGPPRVRQAAAPPNLGPPPEPLDWRKRRR